MNPFSKVKSANYKVSPKEKKINNEATKSLETKLDDQALSIFREYLP